MTPYLLTHHVSVSDPSRVRPWYTTRNKPIRLIVVHTAENLPDFTPPDTGAENVAQFGASTSRASWHSTVDSDTTIRMLPDDYTAWHVRFYNSQSLGVEIATQAHYWPHAPPVWVDAVLDRTAVVVADWCERWNIPAQRITRTAADAGQSGIVAHADLDPERRTDPGGGFPWAQFIGVVNQKLQGDTMSTPEWVKYLTAEQVRAMSGLGLVAGDPEYWVGLLPDPFHPEWPAFRAAVDINSKIAAASGTPAGWTINLTGTATP